MKLFGHLPDGKEINEFTLQNQNGMTVSAINYGGIINKIAVPDKEGKIQNVLLSYNTLENYIADTCYIGAIIGRCANRIANGKFFLDGKPILLARNNGKNHLHGGNVGFNKVFWNIKFEKLPEGDALKLEYLSPDNEENYPGNLNICIYYILTNDNTLIIRSTAQTDKKTIINLSNHLYFNLNLDNAQTILNHKLQIDSDFFLPVDNEMIPSGIIEPTHNTEFDFSKSQLIGKNICSNNEQIKTANGYDHCFVINENANPAITFTSESSGRKMEIRTTEPGIHVYSGNFLKQKDSIYSFQNNAGIAFEPEHFPNAINQPNFPSIILLPNKNYFSETKYSFSII